MTVTHTRCANKCNWLPSSSELSCEPLFSSPRTVCELLSALKWDVTGELFERAHIYVSFRFSVVCMCVGLYDFLWAFMGCLVQYICVCVKCECWKGKELVSDLIIAPQTSMVYHSCSMHTHLFFYHLQLQDIPRTHFLSLSSTVSVPPPFLSSQNNQS